MLKLKENFKAICFDLEKKGEIEEKQQKKKHFYQWSDRFYLKKQAKKSNSNTSVLLNNILKVLFRKKKKTFNSCTARLSRRVKKIFIIKYFINFAKIQDHLDDQKWKD